MVLILLLIFFVTSIMNVRGDCRLDPHPSVVYKCKVPGTEGDYSVCNASVPAGTIVLPECQTPDYYSHSTLGFMNCYGDRWDRLEKCQPECGKVTPDSMALAIGGVKAKRGELPWHAGIYRKTSKPYLQICGGSLISTHVVISAAHCFCDGEKQLNASIFAVAVGKIYRPWDDNMDMGQNSDVKQIHIPPHYRGVNGNYQADIAVIIVTKEFEYKTHIRPVCLDFGYNFEIQQLIPNAMGKAAGWGLTAVNSSNGSPILQVLDMPYVDVATCQNNSTTRFKDLITFDKICAGTLENDTALCQGDSGGGLVFAGYNLGVKRYYLRGVVSTSATSENGDRCNTNTYIAFTSTSKHHHFIQQFGIENAEFKCLDGGYISSLSHCDGTKDCADGSDEADTACSKNKCSSSHLFRCDYGACVDKGSICNGVIDCADGSDEDDEICSTVPGHDLAKKKALKDKIFVKKIGDCVLPVLPYHGSYTTVIEKPIDVIGNENLTVVTLSVTCDPGYGVMGNSSIKCSNGHWLGSTPSCVTMCQLKPNPSVEYRCLVYGEEDGYRNCNLQEPIGTIVSPRCQEPNYYSTSDLPFMQCKDNGHWDNVAKCRVTCPLEPHPSVEYRCLLSGNAIEHRNCSLHEPNGTIVSPRCRQPYYYSKSDMTFMQCKENGYWNYVAKCEAECGIVTPEVVGGVRTKKGQLPWHAMIYNKDTKPFKQICGGSLITTKMIISAAHCFWTESEENLPASKFAVAVGKIYRPWTEAMDDVQTSDVKQIHIPLEYRGAEGYFKEDIAVVIVTKEFQYQAHIRPVCLDFDENFEIQQLMPGKVGKVAGSGLTAANGSHGSPTLQVVDMSYVDTMSCLTKSSNIFREFISYDKICAGTLESDTAILCPDDGGSGLVFAGNNSGVQRYYLRGVMSTAEKSDDNYCNTKPYITFTRTSMHERFIDAYKNPLKAVIASLLGR